MSDLKEIIKLLPEMIEGRELTLALDKSDHYWYVGHPNLKGDFSVGLHACDKDIEGAALNLLSQFDTRAKY
jgi:hypothetical protein